jgi:hypothetical protein
MKHRSLIKIAALAIAVSAALPAMADTMVATGKHHFVYFGDHDIYFAPESKTYFWLENGQWRSGHSLPEDRQAFVRTRGVDIDLDTDRPYERNDYVVEHYKQMPIADNGPVTRETTTTERSTNADGSTTTTTTTTKHRYMYFADKDVYFAPDTRTYYWQSNGRWVSGERVPAEIEPFVRSGGVDIELDTARPYERNEYVIAHYGHRHGRDHDDRDHDD